MVTTTQAVFLGYMGLLGVERGVETGQPHYRFMVVFHTLFLGACLAEVLRLHRPFLGVWSWVALGCAVAAQGLRYWAITTLGPRWNSRIIVVPDLPPVVGGPYRFLRHPNYVAVVLELVSVPLIHGAWWTAVFFSVGNLVLLSVRIRAEEA